MKTQEELDFKRKVELTIETIFIKIIKIFLWGYLLIIIIGIVTNNYALLYPTDEKTNEVLIQILFLGVVFTLIKSWWGRRRK
jgi:hypothetical protein